MNDRAINSEYPYGALSAPRNGFLSPRFAHVIHLVRDPAAQISSFTAHSNKTYDFVLQAMETVLPESPADNPHSGAVVQQFAKVHYGVCPVKVSYVSIRN